MALRQQNDKVFIVSRVAGAIHAFPPPPSELFFVIRRERKAA